VAFYPSSIGAVTDPTQAALYGQSAGFPGLPFPSSGVPGFSAADRALGFSPDPSGFAPIPGMPTAQPFPSNAGLPGVLPSPGRPLYPGGAGAVAPALFPGTPGFPGGAAFPAPQMFPGTPGFAAPTGGPGQAEQMADDLIRLACACGIDGCDCDEAMQEINGNNALLNQLQQNFQAQQLGQLVQLLVGLMMNKGLLAQKGAGKKAKEMDAAAPMGGGDDDGHGHGGGGASGASGAGSAGSVAGAKNVNGIQVVDRMGKQIGAKIAAQFDQMVAAAKKDGVNLSITSGFRSRAEQEKLYAAYKNGTGNLAAKPGTSNHESGEAIDFGGGQAAYDWLAKNASKFGMYNKIAGEPWHYSLTGN
jgi:hypothetical protein